MQTLFSINPSDVEAALSGRLGADELGSLISSIQQRIDAVAPEANRAFANVVTEAYDLSRDSSGLSLQDALQNIVVLQAEIDSMLMTSDETAGLAFDVLPSPEMMFSDPDHVPRFVQWDRVSGKDARDMDLGWYSDQTGSGISTSGSVYGTDSDRFDA